MEKITQSKKVREPLFEIIWAGKNVTRDLTPYLISLKYSDHLHGKTDELTLTFENRDGRWHTSWYPEKGVKLKVRIGLYDEPGVERWLNCGTFEIEELNFSGPPDIVEITAKAVFASTSREQKKTQGYENTSLSEIARKVAQRLGLKPLVTVKPDISFKRIDQREETDLEFLRKLCEKYGHCVKVEDEKLIVYPEEELEKGSVVKVITREDFMSYRLTEKSAETYSAVVVKYWDPEKKQEVYHIEKDPKVTTGSEKKITTKVENKEQAEALAKGTLKKLNKLQFEGELTLPGDVALVAGAKIKLRDLGKLSGIYIIEEAHHSISKNSGYTVEIKIRRA